MKIRTLLFAAISLTIVFSSCTIEKRLYQPGFHVEWKKAPSHIIDEEPALAEGQSANQVVSTTVAFEDEHTVSPVADEIYASTGNIEPEITNSLIRNKPAELQKLSDETFQEECEILVLTDGRRITVKVLEINPNELKYRKCNYSDGPIVVVNKSDVDRILYANGAVDIITGYSAPQDNSSAQTSTAQPQKRLEVLGLLSMIFGITGLFIFGIPFGIAAIILGFISMGKFASRPDIFMGRGFMITGLIVGFISVIGMLLLLSVA